MSLVEACIALGAMFAFAALILKVVKVFAEKMAGAVGKADVRLSEQEGGQSLVTVPGDRPQEGAAVTDGGRPCQQALVIRRGRGGRLRVMAAGLHWWTERHDSIFFAHLRATGSVAASARAAGFTPKSAWNRRDRLPGFARAMDEAREDADLALEFQLSVQAQGKRGDDYRSGEEPGITADQAIRTLSFRENRKRGKHSPRRAKPPSIEAVTEKVERLVRAVKRHREGKT